MTRLKASLAVAGTRRRCPCCQFVFDVPRQSQETARGEGYPLQEKAEAATDQPAYIPVICPVCRTRSYGTLEQIGQKLVCPDCGTSVVVPPPAEAEQRAAAPRVFEEYPLHEEASKAAGERGPPEMPLIRLFCPLCHTMMYATGEQAGRKMVCPDCGTATIVPAADERPATKPRTAEEIGEYELASEVDRTLGGPAASEQTYIAVVCPRCQTRLHATLDQVGDPIICPDCGKVTVVPAPRQAPAVRGQQPQAWIEPRSVGAAGQGRGERLGPDGRVSRDYRDSAKVAEREAQRAQREQEAWKGMGRMPPLRLFFVGTLSFPFSQDVWAQTLSLTALAFFTSLMFGVGFSGGAMEGGGIGMIGPWIGRLLFSMIGAALFTAWIFSASGYGVAIVRDTSYGRETTESWPSLLALEGFVETICVVFAWIIAAVPGAMVGWFWRETDAASAWAVLLSGIVFFPIVLLSMLEADSPLKPLSWRVWRSVFRAWRAWAAFYLLTLAIVAIAVVLSASAAAIGGLTLGAVVSDAVLAVVWLIYFRLLGRLAWFCSGCHIAGR